MVKTGIVGGVGIVVVVLSATLGWILVPNLATDVKKSGLINQFSLNC